VLSAVKAHLVGAEPLGTTVLNRDRVAVIEFRRALGAGIRQTRRLIFEASGRYSNLILLGDDGLIIEVAKHIHPDTNRYRSIIPGHPYVPPPLFKGIPQENFRGSVDDLDGLAGLGRPLINAIKESHAGPDGLSPIELAYITKNSADMGGMIYQKLGRYVTLYPTLLEGASPVRASSALDAARECVILPLLDRHSERARKKIQTRLAQLARTNTRKIAESEALLGDESIAERLMRCGRLILANSWMIPPRASEAELPEWTEGGETTLRVELDSNLDAPRNAERYFAKYKKRRAAAERAKKILPNLYLERDELLDQTALLECHTDALTILMMMDELSPRHEKANGKKSKQRVQPPHKRYEFEWANAVIFIGLSASGNHYVTFRLAGGSDMWLHAQNVPGAHVILRFMSKPDERTYGRMLEIAASAAAYHSRAKESGWVRVDCAERKHVRAITGAGLAQVTYKEFSTINADSALWFSPREDSSDKFSGPLEAGP
jgi:predicted ribosome quality control (RQC) complex YloA/Tae2 family protein